MPMFRMWSIRLMFTAAVAAVTIGSSASHSQVAEKADAPTFDFQPVWSRDGRRIAFTSTRNAPEGASTRRTNIWVMNTDGSEIRQLTSDGASNYPSWSPDGKKLAFQRGTQIWQIELATGNISQMTEGDRRWFCPDWHPKDSSKIACSYKTRIHGDNDIFVINPQTCRTRESGRQVIREKRGGDWYPRWSRDGTRIAFVGQVLDRVTAEGDWYLVVMAADGSAMRTHYKLARPATRLAWLSNDSGILIDGGSTYDFATDKTGRLFDEEIYDPDISPDGRRVVYSADVPGGGRAIFTSRVDGTEKKQLTK